MWLKSFYCQGITFRTSGQLWSNPKLRSSPAGLAPMLAKPSFLDLLQLCKIHSCQTVVEVNNALLDAGEISRERHQITQSMVGNIEKGLAKKEEDM